MSNRVNYFNHRLDSLSDRDSRFGLGEREILTVMTALGLDPTSSLPPGFRMLDVGCGDRHIEPAVKLRGGLYQGVDIDQCNFEIDSLPFESSSLDLVVSLSVIEHLLDPGLLLSEILRVLKPGGAVWIETPNIEACAEAFWDDPTHIHPYTRKSIAHLLTISGFSKIRVTPNYRCKASSMYDGRQFNFFRSRYLMPFSGLGPKWIPEFVKGKCYGLFALARKPVDGV